MQKLIASLSLAFALVACGGPAAQVAPKDDKFSTNGFTVSRPAEWTFVTPDASVGKDTIVVLQGPVGNQPLAPAVEVSRRPLSAMDQRKNPAHLLTAMVTEVAQLFDGFEGVTSPQETSLGQRSAARIDLKFTDAQPDGSSVTRAARFYGAVSGDQMWVVRCVGPTDGSQDAAFDEIVASVKID